MTGFEHKGMNKGSNGIAARNQGSEAQGEGTSNLEADGPQAAEDHSGCHSCQLRTGN